MLFKRRKTASSEFLLSLAYGKNKNHICMPGLWGNFSKMGWPLSVVRRMEHLYRRTGSYGRQEHIIAGKYIAPTKATDVERDPHWENR